MLYLYSTRVLSFSHTSTFISVDIFDEFNTFTSLFFFNVLLVTRFNYKNFPNHLLQVGFHAA